MHKATTAPITLHTDASDYGIGGYLFQPIDGKDYPVAFVSKSLSGSQLRWSKKKLMQFTILVFFYNHFYVIDYLQFERIIETCYTYITILIQ